MDYLTKQRFMTLDAFLRDTGGNGARVLKQITDDMGRIGPPIIWFRDDIKAWSVKYTVRRFRKNNLTIEAIVKREERGLF